MIRRKNLLTTGTDWAIKDFYWHTMQSKSTLIKNMSGLKISCLIATIFAVASMIIYVRSFFMVLHFKHFHIPFL